jgi:hypothetical protein
LIHAYFCSCSSSPPSTSVLFTLVALCVTGNRNFTVLHRLPEFLQFFFAFETCRLVPSPAFHVYLHVGQVVSFTVIWKREFLEAEVA